MENSQSNHYHFRNYFEPNSDGGDLFERLYFYGFDQNLFKSRCEDLGKINFSSYDDMSVRKLIRETITFYNDITNQGYYFIPTWVYSYKKGDRFYRVRKIKGENNIIPFKEITKWEDLWNPLAIKVNSYGRLNYPRESLLYTAYGSKIQIEKYPHIKICE